MKLSRVYFLLVSLIISVTSNVKNNKVNLFETNYKANKEALKSKQITDIIDDDTEYSLDVNDHRMAVNSQIADAFLNKQTFTCPMAKPQLHTGDSLANLSPEDLDIVAAMGDALASGRGLWPPTDAEFRGAAFPIGGDANIDGLITIPNILMEFNDQIMGMSHGIGERDRLPDYQFNVAQSTTETEDLPEQATELVRRLHSHFIFPVLHHKWVLIIIAMGTEEFCYHCDTPNHSSIRRALGVLRKGVPKALVILLGPVHVASSYSLNINLLKSRCSCLESISILKYRYLVKEWRNVFIDVQNEFNSLNYSTFGVLAIPQLTIHSRNADSLFIPGRPLLNRKGHAYAAKWLWNRLITGPNYNISDAVFSDDSYYCPSVSCPYIRTVHNLEHCSVLTEVDFQFHHSATTTLPNGTTKIPHREHIKNNLGEIIVLVLSLAFLSVGIFGTIFYINGLRATKGRFETVSEQTDVK